MRHSIGTSANEEHPEGQRSEVLLELDATVHRDERVVLALHAPQLSVRDACPPSTDEAIDTVAVESAGEIYWNLLVKKDAHQQAAWRVRDREPRSPGPA